MLIDGFSLNTGNQTYHLQIDSSEIVDQVLIFQISMDLKYAHLVDSYNKIYTLPTTTDLKSDACATRRIVTALNKQKPSQTITAPKNKVVEQESIYVNESHLSIKQFDVTLNRIIIWQSNDHEEIITYYDTKSKEQRVCYIYPRHSFFVAGINNIHPPVIITMDDGVYMLPADHFNEGLINKVMVHGNVSAAESLAHLNHWDDVMMPLNVLDLGLTFHQIDTIEFFLKSREEGICKYLTTANKSKKEMSCDINESEIRKILMFECKNNDKVMVLLEKNIIECVKEGKSRQFGEKLLQLSLQYVTSILANVSKLCAQHPSSLLEELSKVVQNQAMDQLRELRKYLGEESTSVKDLNLGEKILQNLQILNERSSIRLLYNKWESLSIRAAIEDGLKQSRLLTLQSYISRHPKFKKNKSVDIDEYVHNEGFLSVDEYLKKGDIKNARILLFHMGVEVNEHLKNICYKSFDSNVRNVIANELINLKVMHQKERDDLAYIRKLEDLYPVEEFYPWEPLTDETAKLEDIVNKNASKEHAKGLEEENQHYLRVSINAISNMGAKERAMIYIDGILKNSPEKTELITEEYASVLWEYYLRNNNYQYLLDWIQSFFTSEEPKLLDFPFNYEITLEMVEIVTRSQTSAIKEILLDELSKHGIFCKEERENFSEMLKRLCKHGALCKINEIFRNSNAQGDQPNSQRLIKGVATYVGAAILDSHGTSQLLSRDIAPAQLLTKIALAYIDLSKFPKLLQASFNNMKCLVGDEKNIILDDDNKDLFLPLLATLLYAPDQLKKITSGENLNSDGINVDAAAFKSIAIQHHPHLYKHLFDTNTQCKKTLSVYKLLEDNCMLNTKLLFGWQELNDVKSKDAFPSFPYFSHPTLVEKYGYSEELTFDYYLKKGRPSFAFCKFLSQNLNLTGSVTKRRIESACDLAHRLALEHHTSKLICSSCVAFMEMLGHDSLVLRVTLQAAETILNWKKSLNIFHNDKQEQIDVNEIREKFRDIQSSCQTLMEYLEEAVVHDIDSCNKSRVSMESLVKWNIVILFCSVHKLKHSTVFLRHCAEANDWLFFLIFAQIHQYPKQAVSSIIGQFRSLHIKEHLRNTLRHINNQKKIVVINSPNARHARDKLYDKIGLTANLKYSTGATSKIPEDNESVVDNTDAKTISNLSSISTESYMLSEDVPRDFYSVILKCHKKLCPWKELLNYSLQRHNSSYCVFALTYYDASVIDCFSSWLYTSYPYPSELNINLEEMYWDKTVLLSLMKQYIKKGYISSLYVGLQIFCPEVPFSPLVNIVKKVLDEKYLTIPSSETLEFENAMNQFVMSSSELMDSRKWIEEACRDLINVSLMSCMSTVLQLALVTCFSSEFIGSFTEIDNLPDFVLMKNILLCLDDTNVGINLGTFFVQNQENFEDEISEIIGKLVEYNFYYEALEICKLTSFPSDVVIIDKVKNKFNAISTSENWEKPQCRVDFWLDVAQTLTERSVSEAVQLKFFKAIETFEGGAIIGGKRITNLRFADDIDLIGESEEELRELTTRLEHTTRTYCMEINGEKSKIMITGKDKDGKELSNPINEHLERSECAYECFKILGIMINCFHVSCHDTDEFKTMESQMWYNKVIAEVEFPNELNLKNPTPGPISDLICSDIPKIKPFYKFDDNQYYIAIDRIIGEELSFGRITEALKIAAIFNFVPQDLIIVMTCIKLADGKSDPAHLPAELKALITSSAKRRYTRKISVASLTKMRTSSASSFNDNSDSERSTPEPVILSTQGEIEDIISKLLKGCTYANRSVSKILTYHEVAMMTYREIVSQIEHENDIYDLLRRLLISTSDDRFILSKQLISGHNLVPDMMNSFLHSEILKSLHAYCGTSDQDSVLKSSSELIFNPSDNMGSFLHVIKLTADPSSLGKLLLKEIDMLDEFEPAKTSEFYSLKVELCVRSHECYTAACNMEGISRVLHKARKISSELENQEEFTLIIRLLTGVGRYSEMNYIFHLLKKHDKFELLFRKGMDKVQDLKVALVEYLKRFHPGDTDKYNMVALHFSMFREIAEMLESHAKSKLETFKLVESIDVQKNRDGLQDIVQYFADAAESYFKAKCLRHAENCVAQAELVSLQIYIDEKKIVALNSREVIDFIRNHSNFLESRIVAKAYENDREWDLSLYKNFVVNNNRQYLEDMKNSMGITTEMVENIERWYSNESEKTETIIGNMKVMFKYIDDIEIYYKLAKKLQFDDVMDQILSGSSGSYIKDMILCGMLKQ
ncbi:Spatacsin [Nymphon striatum]|nr:Spatacsin [Nymphon striatum]